MIVTGSLSVAANATVANVLQNLGLRIRTIPSNFGISELRLFETGSATGLRSSFYVGNDNPIESSVVNAQNRVPVVPDDLTAGQMYGGPNDQLQISVVNTTGGALTYFFRLEINELTAAELAALGF